MPVNAGMPQLDKKQKNIKTLLDLITTQMYKSHFKTLAQKQLAMSVKLLIMDR